MCSCEKGKQKKYKRGIFQQDVGKEPENKHAKLFMIMINYLSWK